MKKIYALIALAITSFGFAQTTVQGTFVKVESLADLVDGQYVIANETSQFVMTSARSGNATSGYYISTDIVLTNEEVVNPESSIVWTIVTTPTGKTIQSNSTSVYVGWVSGNAASADTTVTESSTWTFTYADNKFTVSNVSTPARQLSYNAGSPRFAAYGNNNQHELQFYKLVEEETPVEPVAPTASFDLQEALTISPSLDDASSFFGNAVVTIANLGEGQTASLSLENTENFEIITPEVTDLGNGTHSIQIRFNAQGLAANTYTTNLNVEVSSQTTALATLEIVGVVSPSLSNNLNTIEGLNIYPNPANDVVTITSAANGVKNVQLFDVTGKQIMNVETSSTINVSSLAKGIYVMKVTEAGKSATSKLVIK